MVLKYIYWIATSKLISTVFFLGYVAIAYHQPKNNIDETENLTGDETTLVHKKHTPMHEHELLLDERLFNGSVGKNNQRYEFMNDDENLADKEVNKYLYPKL